MRKHSHKFVCLFVCFPIGVSFFVFVSIVLVVVVFFSCLFFFRDVDSTINQITIP